MNVNMININSNLIDLTLMKNYLSKLLLADSRILVAILTDRRKLN